MVGQKTVCFWNISIWTSSFQFSITFLRAHVVFFCFSQNRQPHTRDQRPKKKTLMLSLRAEYTMLRDQKRKYRAREERETVTDLGRALEKRKPRIVLLSTSAARALSYLYWCSWLRRVTVNRSSTSSRVRPSSRTAPSYFCFLRSWWKSCYHIRCFMDGELGATVSTTLYLTRL